MSLHIIIDGYNLIRQSPSLSILDHLDMQAGRERLVKRLCEYKKAKKYHITVVFDGANAPPFSQRKGVSQGIRIEFSRRGESADDVIKRMATRDREKALVVSSDRDVVDFAASQGAATISALGFEKKIAFTEGIRADQIDEEDRTGWTPTTKKRGPRRRLSKKERKNRSKIGKL